MNTSRLATQSVLAALIIIMLSPAAAAAGALTLAWDPNPESDLAGYIVRYGTSSGAYTQQVDVGNRTSWRVEGLTNNVRYYLVVQAYNSAGLTSPFSAEVSGIAMADCSAALSSTNQSFPAAAGTGSVGVTAAADCDWTAESQASWITVVSGATSTGVGTVGFSVAANPGTMTRTGTILLAGQTLTVTQTGASCGYVLSTSTQTFSAAGGTGSVSVTVLGNGCQSWTATSHANWITVTAGVSGTGNGTVNFSVAANTGSTSRTGTITIAGQTFTVSQPSGTCSYTLSTNSQSFSATSAAGSVSVLANGSNCGPWTVTNQTSWVTVTSGASGTGNGTMSFLLAANTTASSRTGTLTIAGRTFTVTQAASTCTYRLSATTRFVTAKAATGSVAVTASEGCVWNAMTDASWISIAYGMSGNGSGFVGYAVAENPTASSRSATIQVAGRTLTITQSAAPCSATLTPPAHSFGAGESTGTAAVQAPIGCSWTTRTNTSWISIINGQSGQADGTVAFRLSPNTGTLARSGSITVAGRIMTVRQAGTACDLSISRQALAVPDEGGASSVDVTASGLGCGVWIAASDSSWIRITSPPSGTGNGRVTFSVDANNQPVSRSGRLVIAGRVLTVSQTAGTCGYQLSKSHHSFTRGGGASLVTVTAPEGCTWTASSGDNWITASGPAVGNGNGIVALTVAPNAGEYSRFGLVRIAGQDVTVNQSNSDCAYDLGAHEQLIPAGAAINTFDVMAPEGCGWVSWTGTPWITLGAPTSGSGQGRVTYSVPANEQRISRTGFIVIEDEVFTVTQEGGSDRSDLPTSFLAEGATGTFFDLDLCLANPNPDPTPVRIRFMKEDGTTVVRSETLAPLSRTTLRVNSLPGLASAAVSTVVESTDRLPVLVERTMFWRQAGHTETAVSSAARRWYFAEGSQGAFDTFLLLANATDVPATVEVTFLRESQNPLSRTYTVAPTSRLNVYAGAIAQLRNQSFSIVVDSDVPVIAERALYFGPGWVGGHESAGVQTPSTEWFHAEGATGSFFDTFVLVANANDEPAMLEFTYLLSSGETVTRTRVMQPKSRLTVYVQEEDPRLRDTAVSTVVTSNIPVISERSMYWPGGGRAWQEAHNSFGVTETAARWGLAEGRVGGAKRFETFILLANPTDSATRVQITYLPDQGSPITKEYMLQPTSRFNVHVNSMVPELVNQEFGAIVESLDGVPIAVERALYFDGWSGGTNATAIRLP
jgi:hypothetical protein